MTKLALLLVLLATSPGAAQVKDLAWMAGDRVQMTGPVRARETWVGPEGGQMFGIGVTTREGVLRESERMRVAPMADGRLAYYAEPSGQPPAVFPLKSSEAGRVVFENLDHDFPQRIIYWRLPEGAMGARIEGVVKGEVKFQEWTFKPVAP